MMKKQYMDMHHYLQSIAVRTSTFIEKIGYHISFL